MRKSQLYNSRCPSAFLFYKVQLDSHQGLRTNKVKRFQSLLALLGFTFLKDCICLCIKVVEFPTCPILQVDEGNVLLLLKATRLFKALKYFVGLNQTVIKMSQLYPI